MTGSEISVVAVIAFLLLRKKPATPAPTPTPVVPPVNMVPVITTPTNTDPTTPDSTPTTTIYPNTQAALTDVPSYVPPPSAQPHTPVTAVSANPIVVPIEQPPTPIDVPTPVLTTTTKDPGPPAVYYGIFFMQPDGIAKSPGFLWDSNSRRWTTNINPTPAIAGVNTGGAAVLVPSIPDILAPTPNTSPLVLAYTRFPYYSKSDDGIHITIVPNIPIN